MLLQLQPVNSSPARIKRERKKGWRKPDNTVCATRPGKWGNPFKVGEFPTETAQQAVEHFENGLKLALNGTITDGAFARMAKELPELKGKNLACFCPLDKPCHCDVLLKYANQN